jgi:hypothetical protein
MYQFLRCRVEKDAHCIAAACTEISTQGIVNDAVARNLSISNI